MQLLWGLFVAPEWFLFLMVVVQVPLSWVRDIRKLTATNLLANLLILYGLVVCIILALGQAISGDDEVATPMHSPKVPNHGAFWKGLVHVYRDQCKPTNDRVHALLAEYFNSRLFCLPCRCLCLKDQLRS